MQETEKLDALSEMLALSSRSNTKNILITAVEVHGPVDMEAMGRALQKTAASYPHFNSRLREVRERGRYYLVRKMTRDAGIPFLFSELPQVDNPAPALDRFLDHLRPRLDRNWNLFEEAPAEFHAVSLSHDHHILSPVIHHVASDAGVASEFGRDVLRNYHEILTGKPAQWACEPHAISTSVKKLVDIKKPSFRDIVKHARAALGHTVEKAILPDGSGKADDATQFHIKRLLPVEVMDKLTLSSPHRGKSLVDRLVVCTNLAIDRWNRSRHIPEGLLTASLSVNMKGRFRGFDRSNNSGLIFFKFNPEERENLKKFARTATLARIKQLRNNADFKFFHDVSLMTTVIRPFPFRVRSGLVSFLTGKHQFSSAITLLGVVWPASRNGRPTGDSCLTSAGGFEISEVHGLGYKLLSNTHVLLIVYVFRNVLNFVLAASGALFSRIEAEEFLDLILEELLDDA